jgi:sorting nexin-13
LSSIGNRWRHSFDSPIVEEAVDELTRCVVNEWVTNLWYSAITPDEDAPMELRILINGVIAEVAQRAKRVNLITLLSRYGCSYLSLPYVDGRVEFIESF